MEEFSCDGAFFILRPFLLPKFFCFVFLTVCCRNAGDIFVSVKRMSEVAIQTISAHNVDDVSLLLSQWREMKLVFSSSFSLVTDAGGETLLKVVAEGWFREAEDVAGFVLRLI